MKILQPYVTLNDYSPEAIKQELMKLKVNDYCRFEITNFKKLMSYEKQAKENYIAVERREEGQFFVYDNTHFREEHDLPFSDADGVANYISSLLAEKSLLGYTQLRSVTEKGLQFGDKVQITVAPDKHQLGILISACDIYGENEVNQTDFMLHYQPLKKDGTLSKVAPRKVYQYACVRVEG